ncbi:MAG: hypothetical protein DHS20C11_24100 [Lysobacteraceae bacterium]|nr:MAG: hypothetical protein DHS20C11_24100 [Xanthomonadaceae bacterium]
MKRKTLTTAVLAGLTGVAGIANISNAVNLNPDGLGQVLIYPYYTVRGGWSTLLSVVNTTDEAKAVKVRVLEARNSREVIDFNLYLSEYDVWTASIYDPDGDDAGVGGLTTLDNSCTVPAIKTSTTLPVDPNGNRYVPFRTFELDDGRSLAGNFSGYEDETREGYVEMLEMAEVFGAHAAAATHLQPSGIPSSCGFLVSSWVSGAWSTNPSFETDAPTGGLFGNLTLLQALEARAAGGPADAVEAVYMTNQHSNPGSLSPNLSSADFGVIPGRVRSIVFNGGAAIETDWNLGIDAVSAVFAYSQIMNEYATSDGIESDWVVTHPTKSPYVAVAPARAPFTEYYNEVSFGRACEDIWVDVWNREEAEPTGDPGGVDFSPPIPGEDPTIPSLCYEANVISFQHGSESSSILQSNRRLVVDVDVVGGTNTANFDNGWARLGLTRSGQETNTVENPNDQGDVYRGLPSTGFWITGLSADGIIPGVVSNFGALYHHRGQRDICETVCSTSP